MYGLELQGVLIAASEIRDQSREDLSHGPGPKKLSVRSHFPSYRECPNKEILTSESSSEIERYDWTQANRFCFLQNSQHSEKDGKFDVAESIFGLVVECQSVGHAISVQVPVLIKRCKMLQQVDFVHYSNRVDNIQACLFYSVSSQFISRSLAKDMVCFYFFFNE